MCIVWIYYYSLRFGHTNYLEYFVDWIINRYALLKLLMDRQLLPRNFIAVLQN